MKFSLAAIAAAAAFLPMIEAHVYMNMPGTYRGGDPMPPLNEGGADFPCSVPSFGTSDGEGPTLNPGQGTEINLAGTAVHSGGSCQISITYDQPPSKSSVWKVMKSFQGGCPVNINGNLPDAGDPTKAALPALKYNVPQGLPSGKATIAWTWFNRSGNREMYMRCHKATIGGSSGDKGAFDSLPNMFVANIHGINSCKVPEGINLRFPNPGSQVEGSGDGDPAGDCGSAGSPPPPQSDSPPPPQVDSPPPPQADSPPPPPPSNGGGCSDGQKQCGGGSWSMCANGAWVNMGQLAAGTDCSAIMKRGIRFSAAHMAKRAL